jgi:large subunit ribosomal protein L13
MKLVFDGQEAIVGRLGAVVAKELLKGNEVAIINSEKAIISGDKKVILEKIIRWRQKGGSSLRGPIVSKLPERLLKRMIRGMLPWDRSRGRQAYKRLRCYKGNGERDLDKELLKSVKKLNHSKPIKYSSIEQISKLL